MNKYIIGYVHKKHAGEFLASFNTNCGSYSFMEGVKTGSVDIGGGVSNIYIEGAEVAWENKQNLMEYLLGWRDAAERFNPV